jgi:hypothetical protein
MRISRILCQKTKQPRIIAEKINVKRTTALFELSRELIPRDKIRPVKPAIIKTPPSQSMLPSLLSVCLSFGIISVADTQTAIAEAAQR